MVNIIKQEIVIEESLKKKLELICEFSNTNIKIINGSIRKIDRTNLTYVEPHRIIINNYKIVEYYTDAGISAKTGNKRPEYDRMLEDGIQGKIDMIIALKLDRITRSTRDWETLMDYLEKYNVNIAFVNDDINTTTANSKMVSRIMMSVSQNEIEKFYKTKKDKEKDNSLSL